MSFLQKVPHSARIDESLITNENAAPLPTMNPGVKMGLEPPTDRSDLSRDSCWDLRSNK